MTQRIGFPHNLYIYSWAIEELKNRTVHETIMPSLFSSKQWDGINGLGGNRIEGSNNYLAHYNCFEGSGARHSCPEIPCKLSEVFNKTVSILLGRPTGYRLNWLVYRTVITELWQNIGSCLRTPAFAMLCIHLTATMCGRWGYSNWVETSKIHSWVPKDNTHFSEVRTNLFTR